MASIKQRGANGGWEARIRKSGHPAMVKTFLNKRDAESWARKTESELERQVWRDTTAAESTLLADCLIRYRSEVSALKKSARTEATTIRAWMETPVAKLAMARVTGGDIAKIRDGWMRDYAPASVMLRLRLLSHLFNTARKEWGMAGLVNPVDDIKKPRVSNARDRRTSDDEINMVCRATESTVLPNIIRLAVETAARREELTKLMWININLNEKTALLLDTKNTEDRTVPLSPTAISLLAAMPRNISGKVFNITPDAVTRAFARAVARARATYEKECADHGDEQDSKVLAGLEFHDLRHEAISRLADIFQAHELAKIAGHKDLKMTLRYYHPRATDLAKRFVV